MKNKRYFYVWGILFVSIAVIGICVKYMGLKHIEVSNLQEQGNKVDEAVDNHKNSQTPISSETPRSIGEEDIGDIFTIQCQVLSVYNHPDGHILLTVVTEAGEELEVPIFNSLNFSEEIKANFRLEVTGEVKQYKGKLEVVPQLSQDIVILNEVDEADVNLIEINKIDSSMRGKEVQVRGIPTQIREVDGNVFFYLQDEQADIKAVLFRADSKEIEGRKKKLEAYEQADRVVRILGTIDMYDNELEIIIEKVYNED